MKHRELFKLYNIQDIKRNKFSIMCISISLFLAMLVSLVIPLIQLEKSQYIENSQIMLNKSELMISVNYPSISFSDKINELKKNGVEVSQVNIIPTYVKQNKNQVMVYLLAGYDNLGKEDVIISKNFADMNDLKIGDDIKLTSLDDPITVTNIEHLPAEVTTDAEVAGYIKVNSSSLVTNGGNHLLFLSGKDGDSLKEELSEVEDGYKYYTYQERQEQLFATIDKEMGALSLISSVGFVLAIGVLVSGIIMLIIKSKKDIANLMLISIQQKDIIKAIKKEINWIIFTPLLLAVILCIPISAAALNLQELSLSISSKTFLKVFIILVFNTVLFAIYRNLAISIIRRFDPVLIEKGELGIRKIKFYEKIYYLIPLPISMVIYSAILQSGTSVNTNIFLSLAIIVLFFVLWGLISLIVILPIWKKWKCTMYTFQNLRFNKAIFIIGILNLTMLSCFIFIGFNLSSTLKSSIDENLINNVPYNYMIRSQNDIDLEQSLDNSTNVIGYMKMQYIETKVEEDQIKDKSVYLMNRKTVKGNIDFEIVNGTDVSEGDNLQVLISEKYANAYGLKTGTKIHIYENERVMEYNVKGIYDSGGINVNWIIRSEEGDNDKSIYLANYKTDKSPSELKDCYISNIATISSYTLSQANSFLDSFRLLSFIFVLSSIIFNIIIVYMGQQLLRKDFAIIDAIGCGANIIKKHMWIRAITTIILSLFLSATVYILIMNMALQVIAKGNATLDIMIFAITAVITIVTVLIGYIVSLNMSKNYIDEIRE